MERAEMPSGATPPRVKSFRDFSSVVVECAALGASPALGSLSVPPAWPKSAPRPDELPATPKVKPPGLTYQDGLMSVMTGRHAVPAQQGELLADEA
ncbi:PPE family protein, SVP subgroup [Mycobacterium ahvazicum]|uniref:PPE family protein, SVP subgroup n=1 Tax=Mycobacterium ahvazicum TaxID=1964395 RepID=UPI0013FD9725|nr:hypothetical protein [Mycobacterium ahvazicum]